MVSFVFLCNGKTIYIVQIFVRTVSKKKKKEKKKKNKRGDYRNKYKHQNTNIYSLRKLVKAAFFLKSQGMAKPDTFCCCFHHDNVAEQIILDRLETAERDSYM